MTLSVEDLTITYGSPAMAVPAVDHVSFTVGDGEVLALVGESGSGKSSTVQGIAGLLRPPGRVAAGTATIDGVEVVAASGGERTGRRGRSLSMIFQEPRSSLDPMRKVGSQLVEVVRRHGAMGRGEATRRSRSLLTDVGFDGPGAPARWRPAGTSPGELVRITAHHPLACDPRVLVADEPRLTPW